MFGQAVLLSMAMILPAPVAQSEPMRPFLQELQRSVAKVWPRTGEIWPGVDFSQHVLLISTGDRTWAVDRAGVTEAPLDQVKHPEAGGFRFQQLDGRNAVVLSARGDEPAEVAPMMFELASHESFHEYVQQSWPSLQQLQGTGGRGERYPLRAEPRVFRTQLANELIAAWAEPTNRAGHLSYADHWQVQWAQRYADEEVQLRATDISEGTAEYFGLRCAAMAADTVPLLKPLNDKNKQYESYAIGAAALLVADQTGQSIKEMLSQEARTPAAALLAEVEPAEQAVPEDLRRRIETQTEAENEALGAEIEPIIQAYREKRPLLAVPSSALAGSFSPGGFFTADEVPGTIATATDAAFDLSSGLLQIAGMTVVLDQNEFRFPIDLDQPGIRVSDDKLLIETGNMRGSIRFTSETVDGRQLLRAQ